MMESIIYTQVFPETVLTEMLTCGRVMDSILNNRIQIDPWNI